MGSVTFRRVFADVLEDRVDPGGVLVDIGTKDGEIPSELGGTLDVEAVGVDLHFDTPEGASECSFVQGDGRQLPLRTDSVDIIVSNMVLEHIPDDELLIQEAARVLRPDGIFIVIFPNRGWPFDGHGYPPGWVWLPRRIGKPLTSSMDWRPDYYEAYMHPSSARVTRRNLSDHFQSITFESGRLLEIEYDDSRRGELLSAVEGPLRTALRTPLVETLVEAVFPVAIYVARGPVT
jgi:SAM-dependent methyltransferase